MPISNTIFTSVAGVKNQKLFAKNDNSTKKPEMEFLTIKNEWTNR
jgi:hypothetical protein